MNCYILILITILSGNLFAMDTTLSQADIMKFMGAITRDALIDVDKMVNENRAYLLAVDPIVGMNPLMRAAQQGKSDLVRYFHAQGIPLDAQNKLGFTALHFAVINDQEESVQTLLKLGASKFLVNSDGVTPLQLAYVRKNRAIMTAFGLK